MSFLRSYHTMAVWGILFLIPASAPGVFAMTAQEVMAKAVERAAYRSGAPGQPAYTYSKVMVTEELDTAGKVKKREEKLYEVVFKAGATSQNLRAINGRPVETGELKKQAETETKVYKSVGPPKSGKGDHRETLLTPDLVGRFDFTMVGQGPINGRNAFQLTFTPKSNLSPGHHFMDRILARVAGTVWIDAEDFEIARADLYLNSPVDVLGGVLGSLKKMAVTLIRTRLGDGQWFSTSSSGDFQGRKLLDYTSVRTASHSANFRQLSF
jgi:hypothetical protein